MLRVIFRSAAQLELQEAYRWYEDREQGLGAEFVRCVDAQVEIIRRHPELYPAIYRGIRQAIVRRFPYVVLYTIAIEHVVVIAAFHSSRDPKDWQKRA